MTQMKNTHNAKWWKSCQILFFISISHVIPSSLAQQVQLCN